jgi:hypothetical protein
MRDESEAEAIQFDGRLYSAGDLFDVLRDAASGFVPTDDREIALDPVGWAAAFVRDLRDTSLWAALSEALETLLLSDDEKEARFAAQVARIVGVMPGRSICRALASQSQRGRPEIVAELAWTMAMASISDHEFVYSPELRDVLMRAPSALGLIMVVSGHDAEWFVENAGTIFVQDTAEAARQLAYARIGALRTPHFTEDLRGALEARRPDLAPLW